MHAVARMAEANNPPAHGMQLVALSAEYSPGSQLVQLAEPDSENVPLEHPTHDLFDPNVPAGHAAQLGKGLPIAVVMVPGGHAWHADTLACPLTFRYVFRGHPVQLTDPIGA